MSERGHLHRRKGSPECGEERQKTSKKEEEQLKRLLQEGVNKARNDVRQAESVSRVEEASEERVYEAEVPEEVQKS